MLQFRLAVLLLPVFLLVAASHAIPLPFKDNLFASPHHQSASDKDNGFQPRNLLKRNFGGLIRDKWLMYEFRGNYYCNRDNRVVPVDPETGHKLIGSLRKRQLFSDMKDFWFGSKGICHNPGWIMLDGWNQPIPITQARLQYPWLFNPVGPTPTTAQQAVPNGFMGSQAGLPAAK